MRQESIEAFFEREKQFLLSLHPPASSPNIKSVGTQSSDGMAMVFGYDSNVQYLPWFLPSTQWSYFEHVMSNPLHVHIKSDSC